MSMLPVVHIILLNWNGLTDTLECLDSLAQQDYPHVKIHVVDNASANAEAEQIERHHPAVDVIKLKSNLGFCGGNNVAIERALDEGAEYVLLVNNDTLAHPQLVSELLAQSATLEHAGAISPLILDTNERVWFAGAAWDADIANYRYKLSQRLHAEVEANTPYLTDHACGCCMLVPAAVIRKIGLLNEKYFAFYDEPEWCGRMKQQGLKSYIVPTAVLYHKVSRSTPGVISTYLLNRNRLVWMREFLPLRQRLRSFPYLLKELAWHIGNRLGLRLHSRELYSRDHSEAVVLGWISYLLGKSGAWPKRIDRLVNRAQRRERAWEKLA